MIEQLDRIVEMMNQRYYGKYRGTVKSNADSENCGKLEVTCPSVMGERSMWALPCTPYAGDKVGFFAMPPAGASVWIEFEAGNINVPIWSGCFWTDGQIEAADAVPSVMFLKTEGATLRIDNDAGRIEIETKGGSKITMEGSSIKLEAPEVSIEANGGAAKVSAAGFEAMNGAFSVV